MAGQKSVAFVVPVRLEGPAEQYRPKHGYRSGSHRALGTPRCYSCRPEDGRPFAGDEQGFHDEGSVLELNGSLNNILNQANLAGPILRLTNGSLGKATFAVGTESAEHVQGRSVLTSNSDAQRRSNLFCNVRSDQGLLRARVKNDIFVSRAG